MEDNLVSQFKNREVKAKNIFYIEKISKKQAYDFVRKYHYLGDAKFFCCIAYGLFTICDNELVGCATYTQPQGISALKSWFNLDNDTKNVLELSRLCMLPKLNGTNATSYLLGGSIREMQKENNAIKDKCRRQNIEMKDDDWVCRAVITLACSERHIGSIYQVCNFKYYGLTKKASDFYCEDGRLNPRGKSGSMYGVYLPRARKHRYAYIIDDKLKCNYQEEERPMKGDTIELDCCNGTNEVYDSRYDRWYTCPRCTGRLERIYKDKEEDKEENKHCEVKKMTNYDLYKHYIKEYIKRDGINGLINFLDNSDASNAPASTKYHMSVDGGFVKHSINVFMRMIKMMKMEYGECMEKCPYSKETIAIVSLLHDISKVNFYEQKFRNVKDENGEWVQESYYTVRSDDDELKLVYGNHGENSIYRIEEYMKLTYDEKVAILYHMGNLEDRNTSIVPYYKKCKLALFLHQADMQAMCIDE